MNICDDQTLQARVQFFESEKSDSEQQNICRVSCIIADICILSAQ